MHNHFNPHHPMRHLISTVAENLLRDDPEYEESSATLPPVFRRMYQEFLRFPEHGSRTPSLVDLLHHLKRLDASCPSEGDLEGAPELCRWALVRRPASEFCQLTDMQPHIPGLSGGHLLSLHRCSGWTGNSDGHAPGAGSTCSQNMPRQHCAGCKPVD
jgi:hypothetical protein